MDFIKCENCEAISLVLTDGTTCSGNDTLLEANTVDAATEKHVPFVKRNGDILQVQVGEVEHPMVEEHFIEWIVVETKDGALVKKLHPNEKPYAEFNVANLEVVAVYEHCNLHGLWKIDM